MELVSRDLKPSFFSNAIHHSSNLNKGVQSCLHHVPFLAESEITEASQLALHF